MVFLLPSFYSPFPSIPFLSLLDRRYGEGRLHGERGVFQFPDIRVAQKTRQISIYRRSPIVPAAVATTTASFLRLPPAWQGAALIQQKHCSRCSRSNPLLPRTSGSRSLRTYQRTVRPHPTRLPDLHPGRREESSEWRGGMRPWFSFVLPRCHFRSSLALPPYRLPDSHATLHLYGIVPASRPTHAFVHSVVRISSTSLDARQTRRHRRGELIVPRHATSFCTPISPPPTSSSPSFNG